MSARSSLAHPHHSPPAAMQIAMESSTRYASLSPVLFVVLCAGADSPRPDSPRPDSSADANGSASSASVAAPVEAPAAPPPVGHRPRLHISSLPTRWGNEEASAYFTQFGTITDVIVFREPGTGRSRYGFIEFSTMESAQAAIAATDGAKVDDATMVVKFAAPKAGGGTYGQQSGSGKGATQDASRLYVGNIGKGATKDQVREEFEKFGRLTEVNIFQNQKAIQRRGGEESLAAFVQFELAADAKVAKETLHGKLNALRGEEEAMIERGDNFQQTPALIVDYAKSGRRQSDDNTSSPPTRTCV